MYYLQLVDYLIFDGWFSLPLRIFSRFGLGLIGDLLRSLALQLVQLESLALQLFQLESLALQLVQLES